MDKKILFNFVFKNWVYILREMILQKLCEKDLEKKTKQNILPPSSFQKLLCDYVRDPRPSLDFMLLALDCRILMSAVNSLI